MSNETPKVTYNGNTKQQIFDAYSKVLKQLEDAQNQKLDPAREVAAKKTIETLSKAEETASKSVEDQIASLQKNIAGILGSLSNSFSVEIEAFNNLKDSIELKKAELKELFDIEREAFTLAALIDTNREISIKQDAENAEKLAKALAELQTVNEEIKQARVNLAEEIQNEKDKLKVEREREKEEYEYSFKRTKQLEKDKLADELAQERKEFEEEFEQIREGLLKDQAALDAREENVSQREEKVEELENLVASFPAKEEQIRSEATEKAVKDAERTAAIKESYAKREAASQKEIYENKITLLESSLESERVKNAELSAKLDAAYDKIQNMALASVDGSKTQSAAASIAQSIIQQNNNK